MKIHFKSIAIAFLAGLGGLVIFVIFGAFSGRYEVGVTAASFVFIYISASIVRKNPSGWWYIGAVINIPIWTFYILNTDGGPFLPWLWKVPYLWQGPVPIFICAYAGIIISLWLLKRKITLNNLVKTLFVVIAIVLIVIIVHITNRPQPIPKEKEAFIGIWRSQFGFQIEIDSSGIANAIQNEYDPLSIGVTPEYAKKMLVGFDDDTMLWVESKVLVKKYRIDRKPYMDGDTAKMVLDGVLLIKQK